MLAFTSSQYLLSLCATALTVIGVHKSRLAGLGPDCQSLCI